MTSERRDVDRTEWSDLQAEAAKLVPACVPGGSLGSGSFGLGSAGAVRRVDGGHELWLQRHEPKRKGLGWEITTADLEWLRSLAIGLIVYCEAVEAEDG